MSRAIFIGIIFVVVLGVGLVAGALGVTATPITAITLEEPSESGGGLFGFLDDLGHIFSWAWVAISSFFQIMTFQVDIPAIANTIIVVPLGVVMTWLLFHAIRGN